MNYKSRRNRARLSDYFIARELNIPLSVYKEVEAQRRSLDSEKLETFISLVDAKSNSRFREAVDMQNALIWFNDADLKSLCEEFKVTARDIAEDLGVSIPYIYSLIRKSKTSGIGVLMLYDYFHNNLNKRNVRKETISMGNTKKQYINWTQLIKDLGYKTDKQFEEAIGCSSGNVSRWRNGSTPRKNWIKKKIKSLCDEVGIDLDSYKIKEYSKKDTVESVEDVSEELESLENQPCQEISRCEVADGTTTEELKERLINSQNLDNERLREYIRILEEEVQFYKDTINTMNMLCRK